MLPLNSSEINSAKIITSCLYSMESNWYNFKFTPSHLSYLMLVWHYEAFWVSQTTLWQLNLQNLQQSDWNHQWHPLQWGPDSKQTKKGILTHAHISKDKCTLVYINIHVHIYTHIIIIKRRSLCRGHTESWGREGGAEEIYMQCP